MKQPANRYQRILIAPLNWGLGHATRTTPVIQQSLALGHEILIASDGAALAYLKKEFPNLPLIPLAGIRIKYLKRYGFFTGLFLQLPKIILGIIKEHKQTKRIVKKYQIETIISDNRYGVWSRKTKNIFITHQINLIPPRKLTFLKPLIRTALLKRTGRFHQLWIPDFETAPTLSGKLSHPAIQKKSHYIGPLSRFHFQPNAPVKYDFCLLISGPENQRTLFEERVFEQLRDCSAKGIVLRGLPQKESKVQTINQTKIYNHLSSVEIANIISQSRIVICRPGYSTLMDLWTLRKPAILIPTPGQTEQEYLARHLEGQSFATYPQSTFLLKKALKEGHSLTAPQWHIGREYTPDLLTQTLRKL